MNFGEIKTEVQSFLHRSNLTDKIPTFVKMAINQTERQLHNWKCMEARTSVVSSSEFLDLPTRYKETIWLFVLDGSQYFELGKNSAKEIFMKYPATTLSGRPVHFASMMDVNKYLLRPKPDTSYTFDIYYYAYSQELSADADTNWWLTNAWDMILYKSLVIAAKYTQDDKDLQLWQGLYKEQYDLLRGVEINEKWAGSQHIIGFMKPAPFSIENC